MPRNQQRRKEFSKQQQQRSGEIFRVIRSIVLVALSFTVGNMINTTFYLISNSIPDLSTGRVLFQLRQPQPSSTRSYPLRHTPSSPQKLNNAKYDDTQNSNKNNNAGKSNASVQNKSPTPTAATTATPTSLYQSRLNGQHNRNDHHVVQRPPKEQEQQQQQQQQHPNNEVAAVQDVATAALYPPGYPLPHVATTAASSQKMAAPDDDARNSNNNDNNNNNNNNQVATSNTNIQNKGPATTTTTPFTKSYAELEHPQQTYLNVMVEARLQEMAKGNGWVYPPETEEMKILIDDLRKRLLQSLRRRYDSNNPTTSTTSTTTTTTTQQTPIETQAQQQKQEQQQQQQQQQQQSTQSMNNIKSGYSVASVEDQPASQQQQQSRSSQQVKFCQQHVFTSQSKPTEASVLDRACNDARTINVCHDLTDFTGLAMNEVLIRMARMKQFDLEEEFLFWNPQTETQSIWSDSTSQSNLFVSAIHQPKTTVLDKLESIKHEPVMVYSSGESNSLLYLTKHRGLKCQYYSMGMINRSFAKFRVAKRNLQDLVTILNPFSEGTGWRFDPVQATLPQDGSLGSILVSNEVLISRNNQMNSPYSSYHKKMVTAMVDSLRLGGIIVIEQTPSILRSPNDAHVVSGSQAHKGGVQGSIEEAMGVSWEMLMGDRMVYRESVGYWEKIRY